MCKIAFVLCLISFSASAQYAGYTLLTDSAPFREAFAAASQKTVSLRCDFVQEKNLSVLSEKITSGGKFFFRRENNIRMEYTQPFQYLMILAEQSRLYPGRAKGELGLHRLQQTVQTDQPARHRLRPGYAAVNNSDFSVRVFEGGRPT